MYILYKSLNKMNLEIGKYGDGNRVDNETNNIETSGQVDVVQRRRQREKKGRQVKCLRRWERSGNCT